MPHYLVEVAYTPEAWNSQLANPQSRVEIVRQLLERMGARFVQNYLCFGEYDVVFIMEAPDNIAAAAIGIVVSAGGAVKSYRTTPLMTIEEAVEALRRGAEARASYRPPAAG
jgi:uncharacterized protein with GYD domain